MSRCRVKTGEPEKYWLSPHAADLSFEKLIDAIKLRWGIERDYRELKQEVPLLSLLPVRQGNNQ